MGMVLGILYFGHGQDGRFWIAYLLIVTKIADVGAYFAGNLWGKKKLAPTISPKKTVEGAICGLICAMLVSYGFHCLSSSIPGIYFDLTLFQSIILGLLLGLIGQFGDLSESLLKRDANKKDSNSLPGLGGALDSIDSLLFNSAIVYIYLNHFKM
jgi:phosphatidate cytidylyltransferase